MKLPAESLHRHQRKRRTKMREPERLTRLAYYVNPFSWYIRPPAGRVYIAPKVGTTPSVISWIRKVAPHEQRQNQREDLQKTVERSGKRGWFNRVGARANSFLRRYFSGHKAS